MLNLQSYGVHMNGYVREGSKLKLWVAQRARNKATWPGKLDHVRNPPKYSYHQTAPIFQVVLALG